jgi:hypothetical protein
MDKPDGKTTTTFSILLLFLLYIRQLGSFILWLWSILLQYSFVSLFLMKIMYYNLQIKYIVTFRCPEKKIATNFIHDNKGYAEAEIPMYRFAEYNVVNIQCDILVCKGRCTRQPP